MARMPFWRFQIFSAIGGLAWATLIGTLGYILGSNLALVGTVIRDMGIGGLALIVLIGLVLAFARWRAVRQR
jgi:membrane protein DedA with SNARE-associated domain